MKKTAYSVTKVLDFCYGHRLMNYRGKCRHIHGHNGRVEITLAVGKLDRRGMVCDFSDIKKIIGRFVRTRLDHKLILHKRDPLLKDIRRLGQPVFLMDSNPTAENLAKLIYDISRRAKIPVVSVKFWETGSSSAVYKP